MEKPITVVRLNDARMKILTAPPSAEADVLLGVLDTVWEPQILLHAVELIEQMEVAR